MATMTGRMRRRAYIEIEIKVPCSGLYCGGQAHRSGNRVAPVPFSGCDLAFQQSNMNVVIAQYRARDFGLSFHGPATGRQGFLETTRLGTGSLLRGGDGFRVTAVETGDHAASILERTRADVLLSDIRLPGTLGGVDLALRAQQRYPSMAILLQTGFVSGDSGGYRVLRKPFGRDILVAAIREVVERRTNESRATSDPRNQQQ